MNRTTTTTVRKPTQRAFEDWRTTCAARSGESSSASTEGDAEKRSTGAGSAGGRGDGQILPGLALGACRSSRSIGAVERRITHQMHPVGVRGGISPG